MSKALARLALGASAACSLLAGCAKDMEPDPVFNLADCRPISLVDSATGSVVVGAEDLALDRDGARVIVSAYDRRRVEAEAQANSAAISGGGLYSIALAKLAAQTPSLTVTSLVEPTELAGGLHPHGISFDSKTRTVSFINRGYQREANRWRMTPTVVHLGVGGDLSIVKSPMPCSINDLSVRDERMLISFDHAECGWRAGFEDVFGLRRSGLVDHAGKTLLSGVGYANGVIELAAGQVLVAATREKSLRVVDVSDAAATSTRRFNLRGAPDNLSVSDDGAIVVAVHPSLLQLAFARRLGIGKSQSRVLEFDFKTGGQKLLFDDPKATLMSSATAAILTGDMLVIGSVIDAGLVVCTKSGDGK